MKNKTAREVILENVERPVKRTLKTEAGTSETVLVTADWNDMTELLSNLSGALDNLGLFSVDAPGLEGSDTIGFYISKKKLSQEELQKLDKDYGVDPGNVDDQG